MRRAIILVLAIAAVALPAGARALTADFRACLTKARSEPANADCARSEQRRQEARLKAAWTRLRSAARVRDGQHVALLDATQKRWQAFRQDHCRFVSTRAVGGYSQVYWAARCTARLTAQRVIDLNQRLKAYKR
jgi:uncharacterized protein YecT (DUF1311 family)